MDYLRVKMASEKWRKVLPPAAGRLLRQVPADPDEGAFPAVRVHIADGDAALAGRGMDEAAVADVDAHVAGLVVGGEQARENAGRSIGIFAVAIVVEEQQVAVFQVVWGNLLALLKLEFRSPGHGHPGPLKGLHDKAGAVHAVFGGAAILVVGPQVLPDGLPEALIRRGFDLSRSRRRRFRGPGPLTGAAPQDQGQKTNQAPVS